MILDILENAPRYFPMHPGFARAFAFLMRPDLRQLPLGTYPIDGARIYATVSKDPGRKKEEAQLETHEKYIDIQFIVTGTDTMGWKARASCTRQADPYDPETDLRFFADEPDAWLTTKSGAFAVFFPEDAHMPLISPGMIHKVIVKIAVNGTR